MTEREKLHEMTDEELAAWLADHPKVTVFNPKNQLHADWLKFLKSEVN